MIYKGNSVLGDFFTSRREKGKANLPILSVTLHDGLANRDDLDRKMETNLSPDKHLLIKKGDLAYNMMRMWQGASGLCEAEGIVSPAYVVLVPRKNMDSEYAAYLFKTPRMVYLFWAYSYGLTKDRLRLYYNDFRKIPVEVPAKEEQVKIAQILSTWDRAIETVDALIANAQKQKKALMQKLLMGRHRLNKIDKLNSLNFPSDWVEVNLKELGEVVNGLTYSPDDITDENGTLVLRSSNIQNGELSFDDSVYVTCKVKKENITQKNDILICVRNGSRNLIGKSTLIKGKAVGCFHGAFMTIFRSHEPLFVYQLMQSSHFKREVGKNLGATINSINSSNLKKFKFTIPPTYEERNAIASILTVADQKTNVLQLKLNILKQEKSALMQQLLTGKRRVSAK